MRPALRDRRLPLPVCMAVVAAWMAASASPSAAEEATGEAPHVPPGTLSLAVTAGQFGSDPLYAARLGYQPSRHYGLEATLAHNPSSSTHGVLHHLALRVPLPDLRRVQAYAIGGLGTIEVFPSTAIEAKPVTRLMLDGGVGADFFLRDDVAVRVETRAFGLLDAQQDQRDVLGFHQWSVGLTFLRKRPSSDTLETGAP